MNDNQKDAGVKEQTSCRVCSQSTLKPFLDLGEQPLANAFLKSDQIEQVEPKYPLRVLFCTNCNFVQLGDVVDPDLMFQGYVYHSSGMPASKHFRDYAEALTKNFINSKDDLVVELGSNDGHFLEVIKESGAKILGVDPARNIAKIANERGIPTLANFFTAKLAGEIKEKHGTAKVMVGNNVFAHIDNLHDVLEGVSTLLSDDGVFVIEAPYLVDMFENLTFDTIYHEHLSYLSVRPLLSFFEKFGLEIFKVETNPIQGVSLRVFSGKKGQHPVESSVNNFVKKEKDLGMDKFDSYLELAGRVKALKEEVVELVKSLKDKGSTIAAYGAPAKGNTLLNYFGLGGKDISYATEGLEVKVGLLTPGMHIPVVHIDQARKDPPDYYLLLAWNYKDVILDKEKEFRQGGGKFIMPVGQDRII
ncbi:methyltransferase [bacterium]|nr:methyltransferase [bacterium]